MSKKKTSPKRAKKRTHHTHSATSSLTATLQKALQLQQTGQLNQAEQLYLRILKKYPKHPDSTHYLGIIAFQRGHLDTAITWIKQSLELSPECAVYYRNLAAIYEKQGNLEQALAADDIADRLSPSTQKPEQNILSHLNIAHEHLSQHRYQDAISHYQAILKQHPEHVDTLLGYGQALLALDQFTQAITVLKKAVDLAPQHIECLGKYIEALYSGERFEDALTCANKLVAMAPDLSSSYNYLGNTYKLMGNIEDALEAYQKSLALETRFETLANLADLYERHNDTEAALATAKQGLALQPQSSNLHLVAARCERRQKQYTQCIDRLTRALTPDVSINNRQLMHFELGKAYDFLKQSENAYHHFCESGQLQQYMWDHQTKEDYDFYDEIVRMTELMTPDWLQSWPSVSITDTYADPVFLIGFPRSGTTLLDQILDSHSALQLMEEKPPLNNIKNLVHALPEHYPAAIAALTETQVHQLRQRYFTDVAKELPRQTNTMLIDKLPLNIANIALMYRLFPRAKYILAMRHPCDVCLSCFMQSFKLNSAMSNFTSLEKTVDVYVRIMNLWNVYHNTLPIPVHMNRYEDLISDFETQTAQILQFLNLEWEASLAHYNEHAKTRHINTPSYSQVSQPIYQESKYRWLRYRTQFEPFLEKLVPFIQQFGYTQTAE